MAIKENKIPTPTDVKTTPQSFSGEEIKEIKELRNKLIRELRYIDVIVPRGIRNFEAMTDFMRSWYIYETAKEVIDYDLCAEVKAFLDKEHWSEIDSHHPEYLLGGDVDFNQEEDDE